MNHSFLYAGQVFLSMSILLSFISIRQHHRTLKKILTSDDPASVQLPRFPYMTTLMILSILSFLLTLLSLILE